MHYSGYYIQRGLRNFLIKSMIPDLKMSTEYLWLLLVFSEMPIQHNDSVKSNKHLRLQGILGHPFVKTCTEVRDQLSEETSGIKDNN